MKTLAFAFAAAALLPAVVLASEPIRLGKALTTTREPLAVSRILAKPEPLVGKTVQVRGRVTEVCQMAGCWMALADLETTKVLRVKVNDGDIVFPKESVGRIAVAEGKLARFSLTKDQAVDMARHEAEEQGRKFNPASVKSGAVIYQIQGSGAVIE